MSEPLNPEDHRLTLDPSMIDGECDCGKPFEGDTYAELVDAWWQHVDPQAPLLQAAREAVRREQVARIESEQAIRALLGLGVPAQTVSEAIGRAADGTPLVSPSTVLRIGRGEHMKNPRRRRR